MSSITQQQQQQQEEDIGEHSNDDCVLCGKLWDSSCTGWPLCDAPGCPNTCCNGCSSVLIVAEHFYCPPCASLGTSAAAAVGGAVASAVAVCSELVDHLPLSSKALQTILRNLIKDPSNPKYRKLRLRNKKVRELIDLDPCRRLLTLIGFTETTETTQTQQDNKEPVLLLLDETMINASELQQLLEIFEGLESPKEHDTTEDVQAHDTTEDGEESKAKRQKTTDEQEED
jgi:hypothetical protein